ncbi:MAG TPA: sigma factor, partial [Burkholderiaceae bacterium]|nr:sigma factor [Burkholderiaceae bacterium]
MGRTLPGRRARHRRGEAGLGDVSEREEREAGPAAAQAAEAAARRSYSKLIAFLAARTRDVAGAEDALSEALAVALTEWPVSGVPRVPDAWLLTVARRKLVDALRRRRLDEEASAHLQWLGELQVDDDDEPSWP